MHKFIVLFVFTLSLLACDNSNKKNQKILSASSGNINNLSVVVSNEDWKGSIGEAIRNILAAPVDGLPQDEPLFSMSQIPPKVFSGFTTKSRIILKIEKGNQEPSLKIAKNVFAKPQKVVVVTGKTTKDIINQLNENATKIVAAFKNEEIKEKQRRIKKSLFKTDSIEDKLGITLSLASAYRTAKTTAKKNDKFFWIVKDIPTGSVNLLLYELPFSTIKDNDSTLSRIVKIRDSIGKRYIEGPIEGSHLITEKAYSPFFGKTILDNKPTFETKSTWEVKGAFMAGPFVNYAIEDKVNKRYLIAEGFVFAPSVGKRQHMFELEAIIKSIKVNK